MTLLAHLGNRAMKGRAKYLASPDLPFAPDSWPTACFLTGANHWHQTIFCLRSFEAATGFRHRIEILDDGTITLQLSKLLQQLIPHLRIVTAQEAAESVGKALPANKFPALNRFRGGNVLMKKLVDLRAGRRGSRLYLDSDMLFFKRPESLIDWLKEPTHAIALDDTPPPQIGKFDGSLGYILPHSEIEKRIGKVMPSFVNTGVVGADDSQIDWYELEWAVQLLTADAPKLYMLEQTLSALFLRIQGLQLLNKQEYQCVFFAGELPENSRPSLLHYVYRAKDIYAASEWRQWLELNPKQSQYCA